MAMNLKQRDKNKKLQTLAKFAVYKLAVPGWAY